jgi:hypothetical protein
MNRPTLEVADIIRKAGNGFIDRNRDHLSWPVWRQLPLPVSDNYFFRP